MLPERDDELPCTFQRDEEDGTCRHLDKNLLTNLSLHYGPRIHSWGYNGYEAELTALAERQGLSLHTCAMRYGPISLDCQRNDSGTLTDLSWRWHEVLGFTRER